MGEGGDVGGSRGGAPVPWWLAGGPVGGKRKQGRGARRGSGGGTRRHESGTGITPEAAAGKGTRGQDRVSGESGARWDFPG